jgi:hypothetical protein
MIIKTKKRKITFIISILFVLVLSMSTINKQQLILVKEDFIQYVMTMDLGFSYRMNLVDAGNGEFRVGSEEAGVAYRKAIFPSIIKSIPKVIQYKVLGSSFPRLDIDIKYVDYRQLLNDRAKAMKIRLLTEHTAVNAKINFGGKKYKAKLRLKGDLSGHWLSKYKMSLRVRLKGNKTILGNSIFSIQKPSERYTPYDYTFQSMIQGMGGLSSVHNFVHVYLNGTDWGVMDMEEHMSKVFLEKQKRKESAIVRFSDEKKWAYKKKSLNPHLKYRISDPSLYVRLYGGRKYLKNNHYRKIFSYISKYHLNFTPSLYDVDTHVRAYVLATAWTDWHTLLDYNSRYYFNPYTLKLEPITTDQGGYFSLTGVEDIKYYSVLPRQYVDIMSTKSYLKNLPGSLATVENVVSNTQQYLDDAGLNFPVDRKKSGKVVINNFNKIKSNVNKYLNYQGAPSTKKSKLDKNMQTIIELPTDEQAAEFKSHLHIRHYTDGVLELYNLIPDAITVEDILFKGKSFLKNEITVPSYLSSPSPTVITTKYLGVHDDKISVITKYKGFRRQTENNTTLISSGIENPLLLDTTKGVNLIRKFGNGQYEIKKGGWVLNQPMVVDGDLRIPSGARITFSKNSYLIVKGALTAVGRAEDPIVLDSLGDSWKGIYVLNANKRSHLSNIIIKNLASLEDGLLKLSGGVTFYKSDVDMQNVTIDGVVAEDAINFVESDFTMNMVRVVNTTSDGLDSDFSQGTITKSKFSNIGGDALDFSGSDITIDKIQATNVRDKAISGGEGSKLSITNSMFSDIGVGIASKDGSHILVSDTSILNYRLHAAMSYTKKDFYPMSSISLTGCKVNQGHPYIRQKETFMVVDHVEIPEKEVNVKKLYQSEVMKK